VVDAAEHMTRITTALIDSEGTRMRHLPLTSQAADLLASPNPSMMAWLRPNGAPYSTATWYIFDGDEHILVNTNSSRRRVKDLRHDPRVTLTALARDDWYTHVSVVGHVDAMWNDENLADIDRIARHYTGEQFRDRESARTSVRIKIDRWHAWGALRPGADD
jgi:PPOX class probable F420-dependent enzyme